MKKDEKTKRKLDLIKRSKPRVVGGNRPVVFADRTKYNRKVIKRKDAIIYYDY